MATRLYYVANDAAPVTPNPDAGWQSTTGFLRRKLALAKAAATETNAAVAVTSGANNECLAFQLISDPLEGAQTITGTVTIMSRGKEGSTQDNINRRARSVRVVSNDGSTFRTGGLSQAFGADTTELSNSALTGYRHANAATLASITALDGDRIVVELGYGMSATGTTPEFDMAIGGDGTDHANADGDTTGTVPWVEFSQNLTFETPPILAAATLDGTGTLTAGAEVTRFAAATLDGTGTLVAAAEVGGGPILAAAVLDGTGTITTTALVERFAAATLDGTGTITVTAEVERFAAATLTGTGTITAAATVGQPWGPPANLTATPVSQTQINLAWDAMADASGYDIERDLVIIATDVAATSYNDTGLTAGTEYDYRVYSVRA